MTATAVHTETVIHEADIEYRGAGGVWVKCSCGHAERTHSYQSAVARRDAHLDNPAAITPRPSRAALAQALKEEGQQAALFGPGSEQDRAARERDVDELYEDVLLTAIRTIPVGAEFSMNDIRHLIEDQIATTQRPGLIKRACKRGVIEIARHSDGSARQVQSTDLSAHRADIKVYRRLGPLK